MNDDKPQEENNGQILWGGGAPEPPVDPSMGGGVVGSPGVVGLFGSKDVGNIPSESVQSLSTNFGGFELINPWFFNQTDVAQSLRCKPNGFKNTRGETAGHGSVLMTKKNVDLLMAKIAADANHLTTFTISDGETTVTYERLQVYNIVSISGSMTPTDEEVFLVEFEDIRRSLSRVPIDIVANITHFRNAIPTSTTYPVDPGYYYSKTLTFAIPDRVNADIAWTFDDIIEYFFWSAESYLPFLSSQDIPTPLFAGKTGFACQNIHATGSMWKLLCQLGQRSLYFFTMNPNGSFNFIDPDDIATNIGAFLEDYKQYLVYTDNNDYYEDYLRTSKFYPTFHSTSTGENHLFRQTYTFSGVKNNGFITTPNYSPGIINTNQPVPGDNSLSSDTPTGGWVQLIQKWQQEYADRYESMITANPPLVRSYVKVIDVDMETGVDMVYHDCQGVGPNGEGGVFTHIVNRRIEFEPGVTYQDIEHFRQWYRPPIMVRSSNEIWGEGDNDVAMTSEEDPYYGPKNGLTTGRGYDQQSDFDIPSGVGLAGRFNTYITMVYDPIKDEYELLDRNHRDERCPLIQFTNAGFTTGVVSSGVVVANYGPGVPAAVGSTVTISNPLAREMDAGAIGLAYWDNQNGYVLIDGACPV